MEYTLEGTDAASFSIVSTTGQLRTHAALDHETKATYSVTVTVSDGSQSASISVEISVTDVPENRVPVFTDGSSTSRSVVENTSAGVDIGTPVSATDADNDTLEYTLEGTDAMLFDINSSTGQLLTKAPLNHETKQNYIVTVTATDSGGLRTEIMVTIEVTDVAEHLLTVPMGFSLIHIPLKVTAVDGMPLSIETVSDLYDALGGEANVNLLITYDSTTQRWLSYLGDRSRGKPSNRHLTDALGILADMKTDVTVELAGDPLGMEGSGSIRLHPGLNLAGVPLMDSRLSRVSDLFTLEGVAGNVTVIIAWAGAFRVVARPGDPGDIPITGGQSFILIAREMATVAITGDGWTNAPGIAATGLSSDD